MKGFTIVTLTVLIALLTGCATTTTTHFDEGYDRPIERLLVIVGFQSVHGPFGSPNPGEPSEPVFLPDFESALTQLWEQGGTPTVVSAVTVDGQVDLVGLLSDADPDAILLVEQTAEDEDATYAAALLDAPTGNRIWEGEYTGGQTDAGAVARLMHKRVNQGIRGSNLEVF